MLTGSVRDPDTTNVQFHTNTAYRQYNQLLYLWPTKTSSFVYVLVNQSSEEVNFLLSFVLIFVMFYVCNYGNKVHSSHSYIFPQNEDIDVERLPWTFTSIPMFCSFSQCSKLN